MARVITVLIMFLIFENVFAQKEVLHAYGYIITNQNDSVNGQIVLKKYWALSKVKIDTDTGQIKIPRRKVFKLSTGYEFYSKRDFYCWQKVFYKKEIEGPVNLYSYGKNYFLGVYDTDINTAEPRNSIRIFCNDYPELDTRIKSVGHHNIVSFVEDYNDWKLKNLASQTFYDLNKHSNKFFNIKLSCFVPGVGVELGISDMFTINSMLVNKFAGVASNSLFNPYLNSQFRFYYSMKKREGLNKRTFKHSGNYLGLAHGFYLIDNMHLVGIKHGWQRSIGKYLYYDIGIGAANELSSGIFSLLFDSNIGFYF